MLYTAHWKALFFKAIIRTSETRDKLVLTGLKMVVVKSMYIVRNFHYIINFSKLPEISILSDPYYR